MVKEGGQARKSTQVVCPTTIAKRSLGPTRRSKRVQCILWGSRWWIYKGLIFSSIPSHHSHLLLYNFTLSLVFHLTPIHHHPSNLIHAIMPRKPNKIKVFRKQEVSRISFDTFKMGEYCVHIAYTRSWSVPSSIEAETADMSTPFTPPIRWVAVR